MDDARSSLSTDLLCAWIAGGARIAGWAGISALVYRRLGEDAFAMLALIRGTLGLLNYTTMGLAPATIHALSAEAAKAASAAQPDRSPVIYRNALAVALVAAAAGLLLSLGYATAFPSLLRVPAALAGQMTLVTLAMGIGVVARIASEAPSAALQVRRRIAADYLLAGGADLAWLALGAALVLSGGQLGSVAIAYAAAGALLWAGRWILAGSASRVWWPSWHSLDRRLIGSLLGFGLALSLAQLADYLYAPTDYILINRLIGPSQVAVYAPAVQLDAALLMVTSGIAGVLLPRAALAHAGGQFESIRRYWLRGTLASLLLLALGAVFLWAISPWLFRKWLNDPMTATQHILPLVFVHTVIGGSSAVGRSILLAAGRVRVHAGAVLTAAAANVLLSYIFVRHLDLGVTGIILGTIVAVVARCMLWMPWYIRRLLRSAPVQPLPSA